MCCAFHVLTRRRRLTRAAGTLLARRALPVRSTFLAAGISYISFASTASSSSADRRRRNSPLLATEMRPVSSLTMMAMASEDCEMPSPARWRRPNSFGMSRLWLTGRMQPAALMRFFEITPYWLDYETFHDLILEDGYSSGMGELFEDMVPVNSTHCFSDKLFKDSEATVRFYIPSYYFKNYYYFFYDADRIEINRFLRLSMKSFDRSFYNYLRALNNMDTYGYDVSPIIEPTMLPNNVNGGMGIVSIAAESTVEMIFGPFVYYKEDIDYPIY